MPMKNKTQTKNTLQRQYELILFFILLCTISYVYVDLHAMQYL